jgi:hypothetical protein
MSKNKTAPKAQIAPPNNIKINLGKTATNLTAHSHGLSTGDTTTTILNGNGNYVSGGTGGGTYASNAVAGYSSPLTGNIDFGTDKIKIGELEMTYDEFESCIKYLLELTKKEKPEEFI